MFYLLAYSGVKQSARRVFSLPVYVIWSAYAFRGVGNLILKITEMHTRTSELVVRTWIVRVWFGGCIYVIECTSTWCIILYFSTILGATIGLHLTVNGILNTESEACCVSSQQCSEVLRGALFSLYEMFLCGVLHTGVKGLWFLSVLLLFFGCWRSPISVRIWNVLIGMEGWPYHLVWFSTYSIRQHILLSMINHLIILAKHFFS